jgi:DNA-binding NarL/FixJ family response regulator
MPVPRPLHSAETITPVGATVLIVDDHASFRAAARAMLEAGGFDVVGEAADAASAIAQVERLRPAVVLLDVQLPDGDGFEVARRLKAVDHRPAVVLTSTHARGSFAARIEDVSARGFIPKGELTGTALEALVA